MLPLLGAQVLHRNRLQRTASDGVFSRHPAVERHAVSLGDRDEQPRDARHSLQAHLTRALSARPEAQFREDHALRCAVQPRGCAGKRFEAERGRPRLAVGTTSGGHRPQARKSSIGFTRIFLQTSTVSPKQTCGGTPRKGTVMSSDGCIGITARYRSKKWTRRLDKDASMCCEYATERGYLDIVEVILANQEEDTSECIIRAAATHGRLEIVKFLIEKYKTLDAAYVMDCAAGRGYLDIVKYLHEHHSGGCTNRTMADAAAFGSLGVVHFLHENRTEGCASDGLSGAARNGHLEIVKFLHENYGLRCSPKAMDDMAKSGHLETLKFVHQFCSEGCSTRAMDGAALRGHLEVVKFLHYNRSEGCTANALNFAASQGRYEIVQFLLENRSEGDIRAALIDAAFRGHLEVVRLLHGNLRAGESTYFAVVAAVKKSHTAIIKFLCKNQQGESTSTILRKAVGNRDEDVVRAVTPFHVWKISPRTLIMSRSRHQRLEKSLHKPSRENNSQKRTNQSLECRHRCCFGRIR